MTLQINSDEERVDLLLMEIFTKNMQNFYGI